MMTDDDLLQMLRAEERDSIAYMGGLLSEMRRRNEYYYLGLAKGELAAPTIPGRSSVVSTDVSDTVEWMLPSLLKIFAAGEDAESERLFAGFEGNALAMDAYRFGPRT